MQCDLHSIARQCAPYLGPEWTYAEPGPNRRDHWALVTGPDGRSLGFHFSDWRNSRLKVSGEFPRCELISLPGCPSIGVSPAKAPRLIAGDIRRRLLPDYDPILRQVQERIRQAEDFERKMRGLRTEIQAEVGGQFSDRGELWLPEVYGSIRVQGFETAEFRLTVPAEQAVDFARYVVTQFCR